MAKVTFDANIWIRYKLQSFPHSFYLSAVVLQELVAGATDGSTVKELERFSHEYRNVNKLLIDDFKKIRNFCDVKVISGSRYFSRS